jgi:hypothetical protein
MTSQSFEQEWSQKVQKVRSSKFWQQVSVPPTARIPAPDTVPATGDVEIDSAWALALEGDVERDGPAARGIQDLRNFLARRLGLRLRKRPSGPCLSFRLEPAARDSRWDVSFRLRVTPQGIVVVGATEVDLLRASLYLSNLWSLRRRASLAPGQRSVRPAVPLLIGADLWGGFCTTQAWIHGRESDDNFLELARVGVNAVPVMTLLEDYITEAPPRFSPMVNPNARANRDRLAQLARQSARSGVYVLLMGYNPKLEPDHRQFAHYPGCAGASQANNSFRTLCSSDPATRRFIVDSWASLFAEIPELGGVEAITGGEGFYHCFMRSRGNAADCPRCSRRSGSEVVSELVNDIAAGIQRQVADARLVTWPYSANHWSHDVDQQEFIAGLDPQRVIFQTEIDKDSVDWREAGYAKNIWDYSMSRITPSPRARRQRGLCRKAGIGFSVKIECNNSIECLNVPYLPVLENQKAIWENARRLRPQSIHSRWLFDGACKSPSEELGYWTVWGKGTEFADLDVVVEALAHRDFGPAAAPTVRKAWNLCSQAMCHHPQLDYYKGSYFVGPGQPLVLDPDRATIQTGLDPAFFGQFYWQWETSATDDDTALVLKKPLFYSRPGFQALARRGPNRGHDVALDELQEMARLWENGVDALERAAADVPSSCRRRYQQELVLVRYLGCTWRSAANVEEFLRLRDVIRAHSSQFWVREGHRRENMRDLNCMVRLAQDELELARRALKLVRGVDFLDLGLRLDMGTASTAEILQAKTSQLEHLLRTEMPAWRQELLTW